jgi:hypothetical protein
VAGFTNRDVRRYDGHVVNFVGEVGELGRVGDTYTADLTTDGLNGYKWHAIVGRGQWMKLQPGQTDASRGVLRMHELDGEWYAVVWVVP